MPNREYKRVVLYVKLWHPSVFKFLLFNSAGSVREREGGRGNENVTDGGSLSKNNRKVLK
jgi:hypothetical protein